MPNTPHDFPAGTPDHECPWTGPCHCLRDGSLCACLHQGGEHQPHWEGSDGCDNCICNNFNRHA